MGNGIKNLIGKSGFILFVACVLLILILSIGSNLFWTRDNLNSIQVTIPPLALVSFGMVTLLICGVFDLSVGSIMLFTGSVCDAFFQGGMPVALTIILCLVFGLALGMVNGTLIAYLKINPLIGTIGTMNIYSGLALFVLAIFRGGQAAYATSNKYPEGFLNIGSGKFLGIYYMFWIMLIMLIMLSLYLRYAPAGRKMYLTGGNREAANHMGFSTKRIIFLSYAFTGFICSLAALFSVAHAESASMYLGNGVNVSIIISCILGGASMAGGRGTAIGSFFGVVFMTLVTNMFNLFEIKSTWQMVVVGAILIVVVAVDGYSLLSKQRALGRA